VIVAIVLGTGGLPSAAGLGQGGGLGALAVMSGRAYLWGLAANGQPCVANVLDILRGASTRLLGLGTPRFIPDPDDRGDPSRIHPHRCAPATRGCAMTSRW